MKTQIQNRIRTFLSSSRAREMSIFFLFVFLASVAWLVQVLNDDYELNIDVPVMLTDVPDDVVITQPLPESVSVKLNDKGTSLFLTLLNRKDDALCFSFNRFATSRNVGVVRISNTEVVRRIQDMLPPSTRVHHNANDTLVFAYNRGVCRMMPVKIVGSVKARKHLYVNGITATPDSVMVYAPSSVLDTMRYAQTILLEMSDLYNDTQFYVPMAAGGYVRCLPDSISVNVHIDTYTEKTIDVPITGVNFPAGKSLRTFPSRLKVTFRVGVEHYSEVTAEQFALTVSYEELIKTGRCCPRLKSMAIGIGNARLSQSEVDYLIEQ